MENPETDIEDEVRFLRMRTRQLEYAIRQVPIEAMMYVASRKSLTRSHRALKAQQAFRNYLHIISDVYGDIL